jgi:alpha-mannosidase
MKLVLVCNSHIDPVWLWPWEEGLAATLSTFRAAADLCEEFESFVFCHNESLLYQWVEEHEPALFARIRRLVRERRWHVMGGWYLQPDCNLPSGESLVRHVLVGKRYFLDRFGVEPRVAINFDPFGHTRGLPQILAKSGYRGYLFCRPDRSWLDLPADDFAWVGYDGSTVLAHRAIEHYNSELGKARARVEQWLAAHANAERGLLLWGVGNHGGGPSRQDLHAIASLRQERPDAVHGTPEDYWDMLPPASSLPRWDRDLNPWAVGCYTSMATVKQAHLRLERGLFGAEAMMANAALQGLLLYPRTELASALEDLLFCQFHDILPGEGIAAVERAALARLGHGMEIVGRLRAKAFFAQLQGQPRTVDGEYPIFVYNHHPYEVDHLASCEFQPPEPNTDRTTFWQPQLTGPDGREVPVQLEKESCNIQTDQRKRIVFRARLAASAMTRFSCRLVNARRGETAAPPGPCGTAVPPSSPGGFGAASSPVRDSALDGIPGGLPRTFQSDRSIVEIDPATGLLSRYTVDGVARIAGPAFRPIVLCDTADPWGMKVRGFRDLVGEFSLMSPRDAASFAGVSVPELAPVRVIESGPVRTVVEALLGFGRSAMALRYKIPADGAELEIEALVSWFERDRFLKLSVPTAFAGGTTMCEAPYGAEMVEREGEELVAHRWMAALASDRLHALTLISDSTYGFDVSGGEIRLSLLRAPAYAGHPVDEVTPIVRQDRFEPREDQGLHRFRFWLNAGAADTRLDEVAREAAVRNDRPMALNAFPPGAGDPPRPGLVVEGRAISVGALKLAEDSGDLVVRLFEPTGRGRTASIRVPALDLSFDVALGPFEIRTLRIVPAGPARTAEPALTVGQPDAAAGQASRPESVGQASRLSVIETDLLERESRP